MIISPHKRVHINTRVRKIHLSILKQSHDFITQKASRMDSLEQTRWSKTANKCQTMLTRNITPTRLVRVCVCVRAFFSILPRTCRPVSFFLSSFFVSFLFLSPQNHRIILFNETNNLVIMKLREKLHFKI